jgi:hypothetical protein
MMMAHDSGDEEAMARWLQARNERARSWGPGAGPVTQAVPARPTPRDPRYRDWMMRFNPRAWNASIEGQVVPGMTADQLRRRIVLERLSSLPEWTGKIPVRLGGGARGLLDYLVGR